MKNQIIESIIRKSFETYRKENSDKDSHSNIFNSPKDVFVLCPERDYFKVFGDLNVHGGIYVGVVGSINPALGHISEINPDLIILVDINSAAIDYLKFRGTLLQSSKDGLDYWNRLGKLLTPFAKITREDILDSCDRMLPDSYVDSVLHIIKNEKKEREFSIKETIKEVKGPEYSPKIERELIAAYILKNQFSKPTTVEELESDVFFGWSSTKRFPEVKKAWQEGRIKAIEGNITNSTLNYILRVANSAQIPVSLVYLSNISSYTSPGYMQRLASKLAMGCKKQIIDQNCKVIDWDFCRTKVYNIKDFIENFNKFGGS